MEFCNQFKFYSDKGWIYIRNWNIARTSNCITHGLTLTGLSLFLKILLISNTGDSIAYILAIIHFLYQKLGSFSDMEYYFYQVLETTMRILSFEKWASLHFVMLYVELLFTMTK